MSVESRLQKLEAALASRRPPLSIPVDLVTASSREEAMALLAMPADPPPPAGPGLVKLQATFIDAAEYLVAAHAPVQPAVSRPSDEESIP
jgi:hypothetical protein